MEPKSMKNPSQNRCRNLMRKRESTRPGAEPSPGPGKTYKSTRLPVGNLHKNKINKFKNDDWIGFCHYRRFWLNGFYNQNHKIKSSLYSKLLVDNGKFKTTDVILAQPTKLKRETIIDHFINNHGDKMIFEAINILDEQTSKDFKDYLNKSEFSCCNMFFTKPKILINYCEFVFPYLLKILKI